MAVDRPLLTFARSALSDWLSFLTTAPLHAWATHARYRPPAPHSRKTPRIGLKFQVCAESLDNLGVKPLKTLSVPAELNPAFGDLVNVGVSPQIHAEPQHCMQIAGQPGCTAEVFVEVAEHLTDADDGPVPFVPVPDELTSGIKRRVPAAPVLRAASLRIHFAGSVRHAGHDAHSDRIARRSPAMRLACCLSAGLSGSTRTTSHPFS